MFPRLEVPYEEESWCFQEFRRTFEPRSIFEIWLTGHLRLTAQQIEKADIPMAMRIRLFQLYSRFAELARFACTRNSLVIRCCLMVSLWYLIFFQPVFNQLVLSESAPTIVRLIWMPFVLVVINFGVVLAVRNWFQKKVPLKLVVDRLQLTIQADYAEEPAALPEDLEYLRQLDPATVTVSKLQLLFPKDVPIVRSARPGS